ncbi:MAG: alanine--tRNA ligase [Deltaproteobacteria bacterium]|nr:alanine--tRNA ligase [Deltaproteobacteria bacterium]
MQYAWEFLTDVLGLAAENLAVSVFRDDVEAYSLWHEMIGIPKNRIAVMDEKDNFWSMGDTGPCGPCSEIHYRISEPKENRSPKESVEADDETYLEIWNLVFMQYNREAGGKLTPLPSPSIDTGMGLERIASIVQNFTTNYQCDLLSPIMEIVARKAGYALNNEREKDVSCRVIADHIRACVFLIADGVTPANDGRGYVLKRIIRRAARHGKELGLSPCFFSELALDFIPMMSQSYPEIKETKSLIRSLLLQEEKRFGSTLNQGMKVLENLIENALKVNKTIVPGAELFKLYDTYGFPDDLARDILNDRGFSYDQEGFDSEMKIQRDRARLAQSGKNTDLKLAEAYLELINKGLKSTYVGYDQTEAQTKLLAMIKDGQTIHKIKSGDIVEILLENTPFYAESGGQCGSQGEISHPDFFIQVIDTQRPAEGLILAKGKVISTSAEAQINLQNPVVLARLDKKKHQRIKNNHTATHLLQGALRTVLGEHVKQSGSLVNHKKLRFDFSHYEPLTRDQLLDVETIVNNAITQNEPVSATEMAYDDAVRMGAIAIFGEKYGDQVRVVQAGPLSTELCGGTHTERCGNIGLLKILSEESVSSGVRRIEAVSGGDALKWTQENIAILENIAKKYKVPLSKIENRLDQVEEQFKEKGRQFEELKKKFQTYEAQKLTQEVEEIKGKKLLIKKVDPDTDLKEQAFLLEKAIRPGIVMLGKENPPDKFSVAVVASSFISGDFNAGNFIKENAQLIGGKGGGKPEFAQCGGGNPDGWDDFVANLRRRVADL